MTMVGEVEVKVTEDDMETKGHNTPKPINIKKKNRNRGGLLSGVISLNILILGCAMVSGSAFNYVSITPLSLLVFLCIILILTTVWLVYYTGYTARLDRAILYKDSHAGPVWLRGGLVLFGICSLLMVIFKISYYVGYLHCESPIKIVFPAVQGVFILVQTYVLWFHSKDCVQLQMMLTRCGLMLCLSTNLVVWMYLVTEESKHQTPASNTTTNNARSGGNTQCKCSHTACDIFQKAYYYLYPFAIEYSLFASTLTYVMWKNVGRLVDEHQDHSHHFRIKGIVIGPVLGMVMLVAGLATFVKYEVDISNTTFKDNALIMHYITNIVAVSLMSITALVGCAIYWLDKRDHVSEKNPTRSLDVGLLMGSSLGQIIICYFTIVAEVASQYKKTIDRLNLTCAIITILQLILQNGFIFEGLHKEPIKEESFAHVYTNTHALQQEPHASRIHRPSTALVRTSYSVPVPVGLGLTWKRRILKEISFFLLLCNIILWIMPAFGARPQFDNKIGFEIYNYSIWSAIVNIGLPFGIFYRMHSVASLLEVFVNS